MTDRLRHRPVRLAAGHRERLVRQVADEVDQGLRRGLELAKHGVGRSGSCPSPDLTPHAEELLGLDPPPRGDHVWSDGLQIVDPAAPHGPQIRSNRSTGSTKTVAPPTSTSSGYGMKNSPGSMIGGIGLTTWVRA